VQREIIVIPKSINKNRIAENINIFDFTLSDDDITEVFSLECNGRALLVDWYKKHKYYPFNIEF